MSEWMARQVKAGRFVALSPSECWPWRGLLDEDGYGRCKGLAHRKVYESLVGTIPPGLTLDHTCHTEDIRCRGGTGCPHRACVNPAHLAPATKRDNTRVGRGPTGVNAQKDACIWGHPFDVTNTRTRDGRRACRACERRRQAEYKQRRRASLSGIEDAA